MLVGAVIGKIKPLSSKKVELVVGTQGPGESGHHACVADFQSALVLLGLSVQGGRTLLLLGLSVQGLLIGTKKFSDAISSPQTLGFKQKKS